MALQATDGAPPRQEGRSALVHRLAQDDPGLEHRLCAGLDAVEEQLSAGSGDAADPRTAELTRHLTAAGGKRLRPLMVLLGAEFGAPERPGVVRAAVITELLHVSSLHHDDVMDGATRRHGVPSANARWGSRLAVLAGDLLLARASRLSADLGDEAVSLYAEVAGRLVLGQQHELTGPGPGEDAVDHYFRVISGKTAALIAASLRMGAQQAGAPQDVQRALASYGHELGLAFQMADDLLDVKASTARMGKEQGRDLAAGVASLPVLLALADRTEHGEPLRRLLTTGPTTDPAAHRRALRLFHDSPALARGEEMMHDRLDAARASLAALPDQPARRALHALSRFVSDQVG
jgi:heptaprenyl diphosphate synthase